MSEVLTTRDIRELSGWSLQKIRKLIKSGRLPAKNVSTSDKRARWSVRRSDWESFIDPKHGANDA